MRIHVRTALVALAVLVCGGAVGAATSGGDAEASHIWVHLTGSIHSSGAGNNEDFCVEAYPGSGIAQSTAVAKINAALTGGGSSDWHGLDGNKVLFSGTSTACSLLGTGIASRELRYWVNGNWDAMCGAGVSCVVYTATGTYHNGHHWDRPAFNVYMRTDNVNYSGCGGTCPYHVINHETGHTLGLADSYSCPPDDSIMHVPAKGDLDCVRENYPTSSDRASVENLA